MIALEQLKNISTTINRRTTKLMRIVTKMRDLICFQEAEEEAKNTEKEHEDDDDEDYEPEIPSVFQAFLFNVNCRERNPKVEEVEKNKKKRKSKKKVLRDDLIV